MPLELTPPSSKLGLRKAVEDLYSSENVAAQRSREVDSMTQFGRGWESAGISEDANALYTQAAKAYNGGDLQGGQVLEQQARDLDSQAAEVAPRVRSLRDINGFGDAMDWAGGALGNMRSSVKPALGGLAGAIVGTVAAPFTGGVINPVVGSAVGGTLAGYDSEADEAIASAMRDPTIRSTRTMEDIINTGRVKGVGTSFLEAAVPAVMGGKLVGKGAKSVVGSGIKNEVKHVAKNVGLGEAGEFVTEGSQSLAGQAAQNSLLNKSLTDFDYAQALDEAAAGAVAGGGMGAIGGGADVLHSRVQGGVDKVNEVRKDPVGAAIDAGVDLAGKAGTAAAKGASKLEDWVQRATSAPYRARDALVQSERVPMSDDDRTNNATNWATHVLENPNDFNEQERRDASEFIKTGNATLYRDKLSITHHEKRMTEADSAIVDEIAERLGKKSKSSKIGASDRMYLESELLKPDFAPQQLESVADIWRKQGVSEKLLKSTRGETDASQRAMSIAMMGWIQNGFKDVDGATFVPERFLDAYGQNAPKLIRKAAEQALLHGVIDADTFNQLPEIEKLAQTQHADNTATFDAVVGNMTEAARTAYSADSLKEFVPEMRRMAQEGTTKSEEAFLLRLYGSKDKINAAMSKFKDKGRQSVLVSAAEKRGAQLDEDGNVVTDDNALAEDDHENDVEVSPGEERISYRGVGDKTTPYNTSYEDKRNALTTKLSELANEPKLFARKMGAWTALKEQYGHNATLLREKEDEALAKSVGRDSIGEMDDERRTSLLKAYDKTHKVIKVIESMSESTPDTVAPQQIESFREKSENKQIDGKWVTGAGNTPEYGRLYLERNESVNKETGEATGKNEAFLTSAARLIKHVWKSEGEQSEGRTNANTGKGALGEYQAFLRGLAALIQSDGSFTGRIGFVGPDGKMKLVKDSDSLPKTLRLMKGTVADARKQQTQETLSGDPMGAPLSDKEALVEAGDEITSYTDRNIVPSESKSLEARSDTLLAEGPQGEIYRDEKTGVQTGLGLDAEAFAVGGHAPTSEKAAEPSKAPLPTKATPDRLKGEVPFDHDLQKKLAAERADLGARKMSDVEANFFKAAWNALGRRSQGGLLSSAFGQIGHVFTFANGNAGGKYLGWLGQEAGGVVGIAARTFKELNPLYKSIPAQIRYILAHEAAHALDHTGNNDAVYSTHPTFKIERVGDKWVAHGAVAKEMLAAAEKGSSNALKELVRKTPFSTLITDPVVAQKEMFAQAVAMFYTRNTALQAALPETFKHIEALNDQTILQTTADGRGRVPGSDNRQTDAAEQRSAREDDLWRNQLPASPDTRPEGRGTDGTQRSGVTVAEHQSSGYQARTAHNVNSADVTIAFAADYTTAGERLTARLAGNKLVKYAGNIKQFADDIIAKLKAVNGSSINVAGNGICTWVKYGVSQANVNEAMFKILNRVNKVVPLTKIVTGGQTGSDIAGAIAARKLGIPVVVTMPNGFLQRNEAGVDVRQSRVDIERQIEDGAKALNNDSPTGKVKQSRLSADIHKVLGKEGIAATHDSPIRHEGKFNWREHKGKGEGNAAFGAGTYLSTAEGVHKSYKSQFTAQIIGDNRFKGLVGMHALAVLGKIRAEMPSADTDRVFFAAEAELDDLANSGPAAKRPIYRLALKDIRADRSAYERALNAKSPTYHVTVNAKPEELLDWNAPLSEQSDFVKNALKTAGIKTEASVKDIFTGREVETVSLDGETIYRKLTAKLGSQTEASDYLQSLGIVGHKYAASGGRNDDHPNYVIYDDRRIETNYVSFNSQNADIKGRQATQEQVDAAVKHMTDTLGDSIKLDFKKYFGDNSSGRWTERRIKNLIELALNGDVLGTAYHESLHEFFSQLGKHGAENVQELLKRVATNKIIMRQLHKLLKDHEAAIGQLSDPEEAVAYMYQFWQAGLLKIGPETKTFFDKVADFLRSVFKRVQPEIKDFAQAEVLLKAFSNGAIKESATKAAVVEAMRSDTAAHDKAIEAVGKGANALVNTFGKLVFSAEAMLEATGNKYMVNIARKANQKAGERMRGQAYFDATHQQKGIWMNKVENILSGADKDTLDIARDTLNTEGVTHHPAAKEMVNAIRWFMDQMYDYTYERGVRRWDTEATNAKWGTKGDWVPMPKRANYFSRMWSTHTLMAKRDEFMKRLLEHHSSELNHIAQEANAELDNVFSGKTGMMGISAKAAVEKAHAKTNKAMVGRKDVAAVTAEHVAEAIFSRLINANGFVDIAESTSNLGMSPAASAVNKRELSWIKGEHFKDFFEQDLVKVLTTYTQSMVKRAEYTKAFGAGGEKLAEQGDKAMLFELGGDKLITRAENGMENAVKDWKKRKAKAVAEGLEFHEPFPTLRSVGQRIHNASVGPEQAAKDITAAVRKLEQGFKAVMAIEGTLGNDISPTARNINSTIITYQTLRLMTTGLFSSFNDVMGIVVTGGELSDAWDGFVRSMREIKLHWQGKKSEDAQAKRAEIWGTVEATAALDALGQTFGSMYLTGNAKRFSDAFFKWNGMEAWNRAMRITATTVAERTIKLYKAEGFDAKDKAAVARFERLFGKNFKAEGIKLDADGNLDTTDPRNQAAVMRWVSDAIMLPNATHRTIWGSDPHFAAFWQFKQFAYTLHRVMLKGALEQAKLGNYRPALTMVCGYAPVMIAADAVKELLIPGDEPPWMKMGLGAMIEHGFARGGVGGVPQMMFEGVTRDFGLSLLGPTVSQISDSISDPLARTALGGLPAGSLLRRAADN